ncbi:3'(2'),5'-bisphosphate nucleotidase CysQ [Candidatus Woesearchaeota archaeon]|nr:3'(2'),5'-bisphosphate nucleotidase CysQ [Candidatus Woesearchaeota archaeon]
MYNIKKIISISKKAGKAILEVRGTDFDVDYKADSSPLTKADLASNKIIIDSLKKLTPDIPLLSEETKEIAYDERKNWKLFWLIDPLDGTKEFVKKEGEFTVNIALIKNNMPILGVVYVPVKDILYYGDEKGSFKKENNQITKLDPRAYTGKLRVVASKSHFNKETKEYIKKLGKEYELVNVGSSVKLCLVAEGKADIYPRLGPTMEWDTAAAHAVVMFAGKKVINYETNEELLYNKENLLNPWFIVK